MKVIAVLIIFCTVVLAEKEVTLKDIHALIKEIQTSPESERYKKMNLFKSYLRQFNAKERKEAILSMQKSLSETTKETKEEQLNENMHTQIQIEESQKQMQIQNRNQNENSSSHIRKH